MKLFALVLAHIAGLAASWSALRSRAAGNKLAASSEDVKFCSTHAKKFITKPMAKGQAIEYAVDHCALDKKVDDKNFVCPHYKEVLVNAFARESTQTEHSPVSFCEVAEAYVHALKTGAHNIPNMGEGEGPKFEVTKQCESIVLKSMKPQTSLPSANAADFCSSVCEAMRTYARDEVTIFGSKELSAKDVCSMYDEFVEDTHINVEAYMHVVHGIKEHPVQSPDDKARALQSAQMKHEAGKHKIRDSAGEPVKSAAAGSNFVLSMASIIGVFMYFV